MKASDGVVPLPVTPDLYKAAFRGHPAGVAVITADSGNGPVALTATSVSSVSAEPALFVFSISELSSSTPTIKQAEHVIVHLLDADDLELARLGATSGIDRFADTSIWRKLETGETYFPAARTFIRGRVIDRMEAGGSTIIAVEALEIYISELRDSSALVYHDRTWHRLGSHSAMDS